MVVKMKEKLLNILKGMVIGGANVIPGVSGGTLAVSMGVYETIIYGINGIFKHPIKVLKELWPFILGMLLGIVCSVYIVSFLFEAAPIPTATFFVGLVLGALPTIIPKVEGKSLDFKDFILFTILAALILFLPAFSSGTEADLGNGITSYFIMFGLGFIASATMVVPGVSGSMVLMALGFYSFIMTTISNCVTSLVTFDGASILATFKILLPFGIGVVAGIIGMSKVIQKLLSKYPKMVYWGMIGLIVASPFPIILNMNFTGINIITVIISTILLAVGMFIASRLSAERKEDKNEVKSN
jgi:putative membrane protein